MFIDKDELEEMLSCYYDLPTLTDEQWNQIDAIVEKECRERDLDPSTDYDIYCAICDGAVGKVIEETTPDEPHDAQEDVNYCPFCGSKNIEWMGDAFGDTPQETPFHCHNCDSWFGVNTSK